MEYSNIYEKIKLLTGSGMWHTREAEGLPSVHLSDGPHGLRKQEEKELSLIHIFVFLPFCKCFRIGIVKNARIFIIIARPGIRRKGSGKEFF